MQLLLEVTGAKARELGANARKLVGTTAVRIGSAPDNEWTISDEYVSRHHATIRHLGGVYYVEAKGRNLTAINDRNRPLSRDDAQPLREGDRLFIDVIEIAVRYVEGGMPAVEPERLEPSAVPRVPTPWPQDLDDLLGNSNPSHGSADPLDLLDIKPAPMPVTSGREPRMAPVDNLVGQPVVGMPSGAFPEIDPFKTQMPKHAPAPAPSPLPVPPFVPPPDPVVAPASSNLSIDELLRGAGFDPRVHQLSPDVSRELGAVLRIVVEGTMEVLQSRNDMKNEFRLSATRLGATRNNPLKFSANAEHALHDLLVRRTDAYLGPKAAFSDAFEDIRFHQAAMLKGMEAGFRRVLEHFDPQKLEAEFEKHGSRGGGLAALGGRKAKLWDEYVEAYRLLAADEDETFRRVFGAAFGRAYEEQLRSLKTVGRNRGRDAGRSQ